MPHQCTTCGHAFPDGSKEMLAGCPDCGGNKFQFHPGSLPDGTSGDGPSPSAESESSATATGSGTPPSGDRSHVASAVEKAAGTLRDFVAERARPSAPDESSDSAGVGAAGTGSATGGGTDATDDQPETTQATLDALARESAGEDGASAESPTDVPADESDVASRWPAVGTEAGVERGESEGAADDRSAETGDGSDESDHREWPDPWAPDDGDDLIVAPPSPVRDDTGDEAESSVADESGKTAESPAADESPAAGESSIDDPMEGRDAETVESETSAEDRAQADARTSMVEVDDLPDRPASGRVVDEPTGERPDLAQLREELNDQFESIKVVAPGQYELNLMELYDREEYIIAIQENGRYVIEMPGEFEQEEA